MKDFLFKLLFPNKAEQMERLVYDNMELMQMVVNQIYETHRLEDKVAELDFKLEDAEIALETLKYKSIESEEEN